MSRNVTQTCSVSTTLKPRCAMASAYNRLSSSLPCE